MSVALTRGVLFVHSAPTALCPHVEWAIGSVVDKRTDLEWTAQPAAPGMFRAELSWTGNPGTGAQLASALRGWAHLRYEVTEEPSQGVDGGRWSHTPELGIFHAVTDVHGNIMVSEDRLRSVMLLASRGTGGRSLEDEIGLLLGTAWDNELEPFRRAADGAPVRWLNAV